jgi:hypothetical protein
MQVQGILRDCNTPGSPKLRLQCNGSLITAIFDGTSFLSLLNHVKLMDVTKVKTDATASTWLCVGCGCLPSRMQFSEHTGLM